MFITNRSQEQLGIAEQLAGVDPPSGTRFSRAMGELGISIIIAESAEANKGRVERLWGTLHDRLVKDLPVANIHSMEEADTWLSSVLHRRTK